MLKQTEKRMDQRRIEKTTTAANPKSRLVSPQAIALALGCLLSLCSLGRGEAPKAAQGACWGLEPGQALRLDRVRAGGFVACNGDSLVLQDGERRVVLPLAEIGRLEKKTSRRQGRDFSIGGAVGFVAAFVWHRRAACFCGPLTHTILSGLKSLGPGAGAGALYALGRSAYAALRGDTWQAIDAVETKGEQRETPNP